MCTQLTDAHKQTHCFSTAHQKRIVIRTGYVDFKIWFNPETK